MSDVDRALEQARQYRSALEPTVLKLDNGDEITIPPHPQFRLLDDDALDALDAYHLELEECDREPDIFIPEQKVKNANGDEMILPAETKRGALKEPYRKTDPKTGKVTKLPPYQVTVARIALGDDAYNRLRAGTIDGRRGSAAHVWKVWTEQTLGISERAVDDPKSS